jgi:hypothetical protein
MGMGIGMSGIRAQDGPGPFDPYWTDDVPCPRRIWRGWGARLAFGLATGAALVGLSVLASAPSRSPSAAATVVVAPPSGEALDSGLAPLFTFETGDGARAHYEARIDKANGDRRDAYSLGALDGDGPALRVELWKQANAGAAGSLFVEIVEEAATFGAAVERMGVSQILTSSQGPIEWADLSLAVARADRACLGFRLVARADAGLHGVACAAVGAKLDAAALSCLVDRIALTRAGRNAGFADIINGEARRPNCRDAIG